jgi:hypothetical protein
MENELLAPGKESRGNSPPQAGGFLYSFDRHCTQFWHKKQELFRKSHLRPKYFLPDTEIIKSA